MQCLNFSEGENPISKQLLSYLTNPSALFYQIENLDTTEMYTVKKVANSYYLEHHTSIELQPLRYQNSPIYRRC